MGREEKDHAPEWKVLHAMDSHFRNVLNYKTYKLINKSQSCNGKMAARTGKYSKSWLSPNEHVTQIKSQKAWPYKLCRRF